MVFFGGKFYFIIYCFQITMNWGKRTGWGVQSDFKDQDMFTAIIL